MKTTTVRRLPKPSSVPGITGWAWTVFLVVLLAELIGAYLVVYRGGYSMGDAIARTANAYYVLYILPNKLASMGFVWNPLPSLLQLPILLFTELWRPLATHGFAGCIVTSVFAGLNASLLFRYFRLVGSRVWVALLIVFLYAFNPFVFYYGLNGMSETIFFTSIIVATYNFSMWLEDRATGRLLAAALMLAMGFLTRYEILTMVLGFAFSLLVAIYLMKDKQSPFENKPIKMKLHYTVATSLVLFLPVMYSIGIWIIMCWTIMGDPFYFHRSEHSNKSFTSMWVSAAATPLEALAHTAAYSLPFILPIVVIVCERVATRRLLRWDMLVLLFLSGSFVGFHYLMLLSGESFGWLRFYSYVLPIGLAWLPYEMLKMRTWPKTLTTIGLCVGLVISTSLVSTYFLVEEMGTEEYVIFHHPEGAGLAQQVEMSNIINEKYGDATIMMDSFSTAGLILNLNHPKNVVTSTSDEFRRRLEDPQGNGIGYVLVPFPRDMGFLDAINREYPDLFHYGVPSWAELVESTAKFRLYRVVPEEEPAMDIDDRDTL